MARLPAALTQPPLPMSKAAIPPLNGRFADAYSPHPLHHGHARRCDDHPRALVDQPPEPAARSRDAPGREWQSVALRHEGDTKAWGNAGHQGRTEAFTMPRPRHRTSPRAAEHHTGCRFNRTDSSAFPTTIAAFSSFDEAASQAPVRRYNSWVPRHVETTSEG